MNNDLKKKQKFVDNSCLNLNKQHYYDINKDHNAQIDIIKDTYNNKDKTRVVLKNNFDPYDYNLNYINQTKNTSDTQNNTYFPAYNQGPGRGFGNLNINNTIRVGDSGRIDNTNFKSFKEAELTDRFDFIDSRFSNSNNLVFPFPRSGENTRKVQTFDNNIMNEYQWKTPNLVKKHTYQPFEQAYKFDYVETNLPNKQLINNINNSNNIQRTLQGVDLKNKIARDLQYAPQASQYKQDITNQLKNNNSNTSQNIGDIENKFQSTPSSDNSNYLNYNSQDMIRNNLTAQYASTIASIDNNKILDGSNEILDGSNEILDDSNEILDDSNEIE